MDGGYSSIALSAMSPVLFVIPSRADGEDFANAMDVEMLHQV
jgi:hypothetical protein